MTEAQYLKKACSLLYKSNSNEVKDTVILTDEFLEAFQFFRDEWMWHPRKTTEGRGPELSTTASLVSSEYRNGFNSKYTSLRGYDIETSGWKDSDFYIFTILRVLQSFQISGKPLHAGRSTAYNIEQAAKGVHLALSAVISWYNPSRQSAMAQLIEARLPPSRHTAQSSKLKSKSKSTTVTHPNPQQTKVEISQRGSGLKGRRRMLGSTRMKRFKPPSVHHRYHGARRHLTDQLPSVPGQGLSYSRRSIPTEKAGFYSLLQDFDDSDTVGEAAQLEENNRYGTLRRLWVEYRDHWGVHDAPELPEFPTKFTLQMKF
ncbi:hypothetical protein DIS24_g2336 [Lasiodiplodia hormozganensis]|uniref:Uncharacterized protein n=1 Tax=Lasiodiplodia hormozganensis TaxID=869390 RepID=A0AA40D418_9PEZI|nr:hypothetical protein DIS24_g2336 [Lasiodiplodia hormozganensis]